MKAIFIAGTDTGVGKSVVTGLLGRYLCERGYAVVTQKWVETGCRRSQSDIDTHIRLMGKKRADFKGYLSSMMPYRFKLAASPHLAARLERKKVDAAKIRAAVRELAKGFDFIIIEGTGGLMVPLDDRTLLIDILKKFKPAVVVVAANKLGAINHTLLTLEALEQRGVRVLGTVFNEISKGEDRRILNDNPSIVKRMAATPVLGILPWSNSPVALKKRFRPIGEKIFEKL